MRLRWLTFMTLGWLCYWPVLWLPTNSRLFMLLPWAAARKALRPTQDELYQSAHQLVRRMLEAV